MLVTCNLPDQCARLPAALSAAVPPAHMPCSPLSCESTTSCCALPAAAPRVQRSLPSAVSWSTASTSMAATSPPALSWGAPASTPVESTQLRRAATSVPTRPAGEQLAWLYMWRFRAGNCGTAASLHVNWMMHRAAPRTVCQLPAITAPVSLPRPALPSPSGAFTFRWQDEAHTLGSCALKAAKGFTRSYWGEHHSAVIAAQCRVPYCTAYARGTCRCTACQQGWLPSAGKCVSVSSSAGS